MFLRNLTTLLLVAIYLTACQSDLIGSGPITLSPRVKQKYEEFQKRSDPGFFAVTPDGQVYGYSYCPAAACREGAMLLALDACERHAPQPCKIYADGMKVLWRRAIDPVDLSTIEFDTLCRLAGVFRTGVDPSWDRNEGSRQYVKEAKRRGVSIGDCARSINFSIDGTTKVAVPAALTAKELCRLALDEKKEYRKWSRDRQRDSYVAEALRRGFNLEECRTSLGLT